MNLKTTTAAYNRIHRAIEKVQTTLARPLFALLLIGGLCSTAAHAQKQLVTVRGIEDTDSILHNPAMGWVYYDSSDRPFSQQWWQSNQTALSMCNIWYWRDTWAKLEPQQGRYAWQYNPKFKQYIQQILDHGFKLAFRVIVDSHNFSVQATPQWVRDMGVRGRIRATHTYSGKLVSLWSPNYDDPIFKAQFARFIQAFGKEFDDPAKVDFIDANGLGWWGEVHHLRLPASEYDQEYNWICSTYHNAFKHVLLVTNVFSEFSQGSGEADIEIAHDKYGYLFRRDGLGSHWYSDANIKTFDTNMFPASPLFGELCYGSWNAEDEKAEAAFGIKNFHDDLVWGMSQGLQSHINTMNFTSAWQQYAPEQIARFNRHGGYRFYPDKIEYSAVVEKGRLCTIKSRWKNAGVGVLPNAAPQWNHKYRLAYALLPLHSQSPQQICLEQQAHLSNWAAGKTFAYNTTFRCSLPPGTYRLAVGIVDTTRQNTPAIEMAASNLTRLGLWYLLGTVTVKKG